MIIRHLVTIWIVTCFTIGSVSAASPFVSVSCGTDFFNVTLDNGYLTSKPYSPYMLYMKGSTDNRQCSSFSIPTLNVAPDRCNVTAVKSSDGFNLTRSQTVIALFGSGRVSESYYVECITTVTPSDTADFLVQYRLPGSLEKNASTSTKLAITHADSDGVAQLEYKVGQYINFTVKLVEDLGPNVKVVLQRCYANSDTLGSNTYNLINQRCPVDATTTSSRVSKNEFSFRTEGFVYAGASTSAVYVSCQVLLCTSSNSNAECLDCGETPKRRRRDVETEEDQLVEVSTSRFTIVRDIDNLPPEVLVPAMSNKQACGQGDQSDVKNSILLILVETFLFVIALALIKKSSDGKLFRMQSKQLVFLKSLS